MSLTVSFHYTEGIDITEFRYCKCLTSKIKVKAEAEFNLKVKAWGESTPAGILRDPIKDPVGYSYYLIR